jgi:tRNA(adenine34) deaminase
MDAAVAQAELGLAAGELPIGAVLTLDGAVVARAFWRYQRNELLAHPELLVLVEAERNHDLSGLRRDLTLYTTLEPCLMCMAAAMFSFCGRVVFALESQTDGASRIAETWNPAAGSEAPYAVPEVTGGLRRAEAAELVRTFLARQPDGPMARWARTLVG